MFIPFLVLIVIIGVIVWAGLYSAWETFQDEKAFRKKMDIQTIDDEDE